MKDVAFVIVLVLAGLLLVFLTLLQAASQSLKVALVLSISMGLVCSFLVSMIAFTVDETLNADAAYKILLISQLAAGLTSTLLQLQPCFAPRNWSRNLNEMLQTFLDSLTSGDQSYEKSMLRSLKNNNNSSLYTSQSNQRSQVRDSSGLSGINLANISYSNAKGEPEQNQVTVGDIAVPLKDVFYVTDLVVANKALASKLVKCNLEGSSIMVRSSKDKEFESSEQMQVGQSKIMGFLDVDKLIHLCRTTKWETYKIWQAVRAGDLAYKKPAYLQAETLLKDALKQMITLDAKFAVIKKGRREVGMIGATRLREQISQLAEESKDQSYYDYVKSKFSSWKRDSVSKEHSRQSTEFVNNNGISKDQFGNELSRISGKADHSEMLDSQDREDMQSVGITIQKDSSTVQTAQSLYDRDEVEKEMRYEKHRAGENRLAQSERVTRTTNSDTYHNYLNNRMSVRMNYGNQEKSLARRLLGHYGDKKEQDSEFDLADLENPLLDPYQR